VKAIARDDVELETDRAANYSKTKDTSGLLSWAPLRISVAVVTVMNSSTPTRQMLEQWFDMPPHPI